jgi:hypothetical protein
MTAGQALYELGKLLEEIGRYKENRELDETQLRDRFLDNIGELREVVDQKLVGYQRKWNEIPPGPSLRWKLHEADLDIPVYGGRANNAWLGGGIAAEYAVYLPRKQLDQSPYFFIQTRGAEGSSKRGWVPQKANFMYGLSSYQVNTFADDACKAALVDYMYENGEEFLGERKHLTQGGRGIFLNQVQNQGQNVQAVGGRGASSLELSEIKDKQELVEWARGAKDWGIQGSSSLDEVQAMSNSDLLDRVWAVWLIASKPARTMFELTRRTPSRSVFISYRRDDFGGSREKAKPYLSQLEEAIREHVGGGVEVFWDNYLSRDGNYETELLKQAKNAWLMIVLMGENYFDAKRWPSDGDFCRKEYDVAVQNKVPIWCVSVNGAKAPDNDLVLSLRLKSRMNVDGKLDTLDQTFPEDAATVADKVADYFEEFLRPEASSGA